ncbi:TPA: hypothetical protein OL743_003600 [Enterobacter cloacae]|jgi:hypothetical protein|nr:hypothetical protein [Enterobacter cloacae]HCQ7231524.1 hypothetical protein [Enterobacter cloacae]HDR2402487.1 hypothetical protein [Enterobacter bugandensis]
MKTLGIRAEPSRVWYAVFCSETQTVLNVDSILLPETLNPPEQLKLIRYAVIDIIREYGINYAGIRMFEGNAQNIPIERFFIEGVIQESFASSELKNYYVFRLSSLAKRFAITATALKNHINDGDEVFGIDLSALRTKAERESVLAAVGASL